MKKCKKCTIEKPYNQFHRCTKLKDGYLNECKECRLGHKPHKPILEGLKLCSKCNKMKDIELFSFISMKYQRRQSHCKKCRSEYIQLKRKNNPIKESLRKRKQTLKSKYGLDIKDYEIMYANQNGRCKICNNPYKLLHIDHCHNTDKIRGLLCSGCNIGLGHFKDSIELLKSAMEYLKNTGTDKSNL